MDLTGKKCKPCEGGTPPLAADALNRYMSDAVGWALEEGRKIKREFTFADFARSMEFVNRVASLAEQEGHHPALFINYNKVRITLTTHSIGGLSENDFIMAAKINALL